MALVATFHERVFPRTSKGRGWICSAIIICWFASLYPALAQNSTPDRLGKARAEINLVENAADRAVYACERAQIDKCEAEARTAANAASRALYALDRAIEERDGVARPVEPEPIDTMPVLVALGDSITAWAGSYADRVDPEAYAVRKVAKGGAGLDWISEQVPAVLESDPDIVSVFIGANDVVDYRDAVGDASIWSERLFSMTDRLRAGGATVIVGTVLPQCLDGHNNLTYAQNFPKHQMSANAHIKEALTTGRIDAVADFASHARLAQGCDVSVYHDGVHVTEAGQAFMAEVFNATLARLAGEPVDPGHEGHHPDPPATGWMVSPSLDGGPDANFGFDTALGLQAAWGNGKIPDIYGVHEGAFRFTCGGDGPLAYDDFVIYPRQPGVSHLHKAWGSFEFDAFTTSETLAAEPRTNCNDSPYSLNRSAYWMPALIDDQGLVREPDLVSVYYKRPRSISPQCTPSSGRYMGECVGLPNDIRFVFGWDPVNPTAPVNGASWYCSGGGGKHYSNLNDVFASGCGAGDTLIANTVAPPCWDGKHLDSPDHRSHMAFGSYGSWGYYRCPTTHPFVIPQEENKVAWTVTADMIAADGTSRVRLSSDPMLAGAKPGETLHADYAEKWQAKAKRIWMEHCIEKGLSCSGGDLGNGLQLRGASQPSYGWKNPKPRVPKPPR